MPLLNSFRFGLISLEPDDLPDLTGHWDFSDASSVTESGGVISAIAPQASASTSLSFEQADSGRRPSTTTLGGIGAASFAGDFMTLTGSDPDFAFGSGDMTIIVVYQRASGASSSNRILYSQGASSTVDFLSLLFNSDGNNLQYNLSDRPTVEVAVSSGEDFSDGNAHVAIARRTGTLQEILDDNGNQIASNTLPGGYSIANGTPVALGGIFAPPTTFNEQYNGIIGECIVYDRALTSGEVSGLLLGLRTKWSI
jgi:hypothetical protein